MKIRLALAAACMMALSAQAIANPQRTAILDRFAAEAKQQDKAFSAFSAERGKALFMDKHTGGKPEFPACASCHTSDPKSSGQTKAGKEIPPMAVSKTPTRFTDPAEVEKWFGRNCNQVLGRDCTASEKGDFITFLISQ
ncbi:conserved exported hypothetical protein [Rhodospirillaceae bacterium LM-1]|nr:conserved exported hypothetical protein [Rhodospirillaceae bacterium LM-1]